MAKKKEAAVGIEGFDKLSKNDFIDADTSGTRMISNQPEKNDEINDPEVDKIMNAHNNLVKAGEKAQVQKEESDVDVLEAEEEEVSDENPAAEEEKEEEKKAPSDKKDDKNKEPEKKESVEDDTKPLAFDDTDTAAPVVNEGEETTWPDVAKDLGVELNDNNYESFKEAIKNAKEISIAKYKPETQRLIKFTEAGGKIEDFIEPTSKIDAAMKLADADLVESALFNEGWTNEETRNKKIAQMSESGELEIVAKNLRTKLSDIRKKEVETIIDARIKAQEKYEEQQRNAPKNEAKFIKEVLEKKKEFMGTPLNENNIKKIVTKYEQGLYHEDFKKPGDIADFLLWKEYGQAAMKNLRVLMERELKAKYKDKFHNMPPANLKAGVRRTNNHLSGQAPEGNFDLLERDLVRK